MILADIDVAYRRIIFSFLLLVGQFDFFYWEYLFTFSKFVKISNVSEDFMGQMNICYACKKSMISSNNWRRFQNLGKVDQIKI